MSSVWTVTSERSPRSLSKRPADAGVEAGAAAARGVDLALHLGVDLAGRHDARAVARDRVRERAVADVGRQLVERLARAPAPAGRAARSGGRARAPARARAERSSSRGEHTAARERARKGRPCSPTGGVLRSLTTRCVPVVRGRALASFETRGGVAEDLDAAARRRGPAGAGAQAADRRAARSSWSRRRWPRSWCRGSTTPRSAPPRRGAREGGAAAARRRELIVQQRPRRAGAADLRPAAGSPPTRARDRPRGAARARRGGDHRGRAHARASR